MAWYIMYDEDLVRSQGAWANHGYIDKIFMNGRWKYIYDRAQAAGARLRQGASNMANRFRQGASTLIDNARRNHAATLSSYKTAATNINSNNAAKHAMDSNSGRAKAKSRSAYRKFQRYNASYNNMQSKTLQNRINDVRNNIQDKISNIGANRKRRAQASHTAWRNADQVFSDYAANSPSGLVSKRDYAKNRSKLNKMKRYKAEAERAKKRSKRII